MRSFWNRIKRFFTRDYSKPIRNYDSHGSGNTSFSPKWGFIVPHTKMAPGAQGFLENSRRVIEYFYALEFISLLSFPFQTRDIGGVYGAAKRLINSGINASVEPHCNAYNGNVSGYEILVLDGDQLSYEYAVNFIEQFRIMFPERKFRRIIKTKSGTRGHNNLVQAKKAGMEVALLTEFFFIDNPKDFILEERMAEFFRKAMV